MQLRQIKSLLDSISTRPNKSSWEWKGSASILSFILLYAIYLLRLLSVLQISKRIYRFFVTQINNYSIDKESKRVNVPPLFVEVYYILFAFLLFTLPPEWKWSSYICVYYMIESSVWVVYYHVLRRFYEEKYAIMHTLEYFVLLPVIILTQGRCISIIEKIPISQAFGYILNPVQDAPIYASILNILYIAVVLGIIISMLPSEQIKEKNTKKYDISILGSGNVVMNRLIPALLDHKTNLNVIVYDIKFGKGHPLPEPRKKIT